MSNSGSSVTGCLGRRRRMPLYLDVGPRGDTALCLRLPLCSRGYVRVARGGNGCRAACWPGGAPCGLPAAAAVVQAADTRATVTAMAIRDLTSTPFEDLVPPQHA